jgi:ribosome-associated translation inhibitor RaiA
MAEPVIDTSTDLVKHKLQIHFDPHECQPTERELADLADDADSLARQVGNFPQADLRVLIERNARSDEYAVKLTLILPSEVLVTSDHDRVLHAAFERSLASLEDEVKEYKDRLGQAPERRKAEAGTDRELVPSVALDADALDRAVAAGDYAAFRAAIAPYEDSLRVRAGRWVERHPTLQAQMGKGLETVDLAEGVFLAAFEQHASRPPVVPYGTWLENLLDPVLRAIERHPDRELENINMARAAVDAGPANP